MGAETEAGLGTRGVDGETLALRRVRTSSSTRGRVAAWALGAVLAAAPDQAAGQSGSQGRDDGLAGGAAAVADEAVLDGARGALQALRQYALVGRERAQSRQVEAFATRLAADVAADVFRLENYARRQGRSAAAFGVIPDAPPPARLVQAGIWAEALRNAPTERFDELFVAAAAKNLEAARRVTGGFAQASSDRALGDILGSFQRRVGGHAAEAAELAALVQAPPAAEPFSSPGLSPGVVPASAGASGAAPASGPAALAPPVEEQRVEGTGGEPDRR